MTNSPTPENEPNLGASDRRWVRQLKRIGIPLGVVSLAGVAGGVWWGWNFVNTELSPLVEKNLSQSINRPVKLGRVERFTPFSLRFGKSSVPPTATDPDQLSIEAVDVSFNPFRLIFSRDLNLDITAVKPEIYLEQAKDGAWVETQIQQEEQKGPVKTELKTIRFQDARAVLVPWSTELGKPGKPIALANVNGQVGFFDQNKRFSYEAAGKSEAGGSFDVKGETRQLPRSAQAPTNAPINQLSLQTNLQIKGQDFLVSEIDRLVNIPELTFSSGRASGNLLVELRSDQKLPNLVGTAQFKDVTLKAQGVPRPFTQAKGGLQLKGTTIQLENANAFYGKVPAVVNGAVDLKQGFDLAIKVKPSSLPNVVDALKLPLPFPVAGEVAANLKLTGPLEKPVLTGIAQNTKPGQFDRVAVSKYGGQFRLDTSTSILNISNVRATPTAGGLVTGGGTINLQEPTQVALNFQATDVPGDAIARSYNSGGSLPFTVGLVNAKTQIAGPADNMQILTNWQASQGQYPASGEILIANGVTTLRDTVIKVAGGTANVQARAANGRWQASVNGSGIRLNQFSPDLRGLFSGNLALTGSLSSFSPSSIRGQGQVNFSQGIAVVGAPLTAQIQWDGQKLLVQNATAPGLSANGAVFARLEGQGAPAITGLDLNVRASDYNLQAFTLPLPVQVSYSGRVDFSGRVQGTPTDPRVAGDLALKNFVLNDYAFEPLMTGSVRVARGVNLNVAGERDRIAVTLGSNYQLLAFDIKRDDAIATGRSRGNSLLVEAQNFPLNIFTPPGMAALFPVSGKASGNFEVNLAQQSVVGKVAIANPGFGGYRADQFGGQIRFENGVATLSGAELRRGTSVFQINGTASLQGGNPTVKGKVTLDKAKLQDILGLAQLFDIQDLTRGVAPPIYSSAADVETTPIDLTNAPVLLQLRRLAEIQALLQMEQERRAEAPIPQLSELTGTVSGEVSLAGSLKSGFNANFNLNGQDWVWGPYSAKQVVAIGGFENGVVTLLPLRFQSDNSFISFSGQLGGKEPSGQFRMENIPVESLQRLVSLPLPIEGNLNATATLAGTWDNPQAIGEVSLTNGVLNGTPVQQARGGFQYANARLDFGSRVVIEGPEPIVISGSLPFQLPYQGAVKPNNDRISLNINVKDDGLSVLNVLNNQVEWVDGKGTVALQVRGTLKNPDAQGSIQLQGATLRAKSLPDPITDVHGTITFNRDRFTITDPIVGQLSRGQVYASGTLPLARPFALEDPDAGKFIAVRLENLRLSLKGLYQGAVNGGIDVMGTALNPSLGGQITLSDGQILLSDEVASGGGGTAPAGESEAGSNVEFNNLKLELGKNLRITRAPILNFVASGGLTINGDLSEPRPSGIINLNSGQVNLFATQFVLARGYPQRAEFLPQQGLDPNLDIRLVTVVSEVIGSRQPVAASPNEIVDTTTFNRYGSLQSVRVQARITGPASELNENLELTSSPARSESEIISLIGGGFISTLGQGGGALGLANIAGSALLTNVQGFIGNALGLSDFRLFPTITPSDDRNRSNTASRNSIDLAMEAGIDITRSLSVSVLKILTSDKPAQFGLRYRLNDQLLLRTSTDFSGDNQAVLEYEARF